MKWLMAMVVLTATIGSAPHPIAIVINGNTLSLQPPARIQHGLLLVPLRHTIEALGLTFSQSGKRITTQVGSKTVMVTVGSRVAQIDKQSVTLEAPAPRTVSASSVPPGVGDFAPNAGVTVNTSKPAVYASFASDAVPVNPSSALLWINGRDVTSECVRTADFIQYLPQYSYPDGPVHVTVRVADEAGNTTTKSWAFTIRTH
jgi:hypothetical protein